MKQMNRRKSNKRLLTSIYGKDPAELSNSQKSAEALTLNSILNYRPKKKKKDVEGGESQLWKVTRKRTVNKSGVQTEVITFSAVKFLEIWSSSSSWLDFPGGSVVRNLPANAGDMDSIAGSGRSPGEGNGNPLQYSYLGNPTDRGAWWATVHGVTKGQKGLSI